MGIFQTDNKGDYLYVNAKWHEISGLTAEEIHDGGWFKNLHPDDRDRVGKEWSEFVTENKPFKTEFRFLRSDGSTSGVMGQALPQENMEGFVTGYIGTITDIRDLIRGG